MQVHNHARVNLDRKATAVGGAIGLQDEYRKELERRFRELRGVIRETVVENDALKLPARTNIEAEEDFEFEKNPAKQVAFDNRLQKWIDDGILEPVSEEQRKNGDHYTAYWVNAGYAAGLEFANQQLSEVGMDVASPDEVRDLFRRPIHADELEILYTRNYAALEDITEDVDKSISTILTKAMRKGWNAQDAADKMTAEVEDIQRSRARTMARSEIMHAHNQSAFNRYREYGVEEVRILTHDPCPICRPIGLGDPYPIGEVPKGGPPFHPNCVCVPAPVV